MNYPKSRVALFLLVCFMLSCGTVPKMLVPNTIQLSVVDMSPLPQVPVSPVKTDTVKFKLSDNQKIFYDKYFVPEFTALKQVVTQQSLSLKNQSESIRGLSEIIANMRIRSIRRNNSMQTVMSYERQERVKLEKVYLDEQRKQVARNATQISNLGDIANALITATIIEILCIVGLVAIAVSLWKKVRILDNRISHV